jgi:predicted enzyme related to lactoylglutathione lyase
MLGHPLAGKAVGLDHAEHVEVKLGTSVIGISSDAGLARHGLPPHDRGGHAFELAIGCDDADAAFGRLTAAGCAAVRAPFDTDAGNRVAYVEDFDGNRISVYARLHQAN